MTSLLTKIKTLDTKISTNTQSISNKQNILTPGTNITIDSNNIISSSGSVTQAQLDEKQFLITSSTDLTCKSISTQLGSNGTTNFINGFEFTRAFAHNLQLNSGFDFDGVKTNIIVYNRNTGGCLLNGKSQLFLQAGNVLHNITESGFKIGETSTATEALDVAGHQVVQ